MTTINVDLDGDGVVEQVIADGRHTEVRKEGAVLWAHDDAIDGYNRSDDDAFVAVDIDGDHRQDLFTFNSADNWTGIFKWSGVALQTIWASASPIEPPPATMTTWIGGTK